MHLIWATDDFKVSGQPYPGFPIILHDSMESATEVNEFLRHYLLRGAIGSARSWPNAGRALYDYLGFLDVHDLRWTDVHRGDEKGLVAAYRDYCFREMNLARSTIRQRLLYICSFYEYALIQGWISKLPFHLEERRVQATGPGVLSHINASGGIVVVRDVMPRAHKSLPKFLTKDEVRALVQATQNPHHRMLIRMALQTGLRLEELASFPIAYVFNPDASHQKGRNIMVTLDPYDGSGIKTKGSKVRDIWMRREFMAELYRYSVLTRGELAAYSSSPSQTLFLTQLGKPYASHGKHIEVVVREIGKRIGIRVHPHMLRHTYATHTLATLQRNRATQTVEPLSFLQRQLGHASIATTMVYLHLINSLVDDAVLAYDDELNDWSK